MNPAFLNSNSTSHTWPFSAVAELVGKNAEARRNNNDLGSILLRIICGGLLVSARVTARERACARLWDGVQQPTASPRGEKSRLRETVCMGQIDIAQSIASAKCCALQFQDVVIVVHPSPRAVLPCHT